jgi:hypothetical protein
MSFQLPPIFNRVTLIGSGCLLVAIGALIGNIPRIYRDTFTARRHYAARLRAAGEEERAARVEAETAYFVRRAPMYGLVLVSLGVASIIAGLLVHG